MTKFGIGQAVRRVEDERFLTGSGEFVGDLSLPRQCFGVSVLSPHAHARIIGIDVSEAEAAPGVVCVLSGKDAEVDKIGALPPHFMPEAWGGPKGYATLRPVLLSDRVRCVGDRVAFVVAETEAQARDAAELVRVEYDPLPPVVDVERAIDASAPKIWPDCAKREYRHDHRFRGQGAPSMRPSARRSTSQSCDCTTTGSPRAPSSHGRRSETTHVRSDSYTLYTTSQDPHGVKTKLATAVFNVPETKIRVVSPDVGGGFGMKANIYPDDVLVLWASRRCGRPVKWTATRGESLVTDTHARDQVIYGEIALDEHGKILAVRARAYQALGAYWWAAITAPLFFSLMLIPSVYDIQTIDLSTSAVFTNTAPTSVYRGAGRPEAIYFIERMLDEAARVSGIDRVELRRRNLIKPEALPYHTPTHHNYDSGEFERLMDQCLALADWDGYESRRKASAKAGKLRGRAVTPYIELGGVFNERMELRFDPSGMVSIIAGTHSHGQGHATAFAQLVSEWLGVPLDAIRYIQGDTEKVAIGRGTFAARSSMVGGVAPALCGGCDHRQGEADGGHPARGIGRRHRIQGRHLQGRRHRQGDPAHDRGQSILRTGRTGAEVRARPRRCRLLFRRPGRRTELSERLPGLRSRGRSGDRTGHCRSLRGSRRSRHDHQSDDLRRADPGRNCTGPRSGAA